MVFDPRSENTLVLEMERSPGGDTQVTQPQFFVNEIKVIVEAFTLVKLKECFSSGLIMPRPVGIALLHGRKDMYQPFGFSGFENDFLNAVIFAESVEFTDKLDFNTIFISDAPGI